MPARRRYDTSQHRWDALIKPILPEKGGHRLFVELGCNAGFYLRKASELGYQTIGVEKEQNLRGADGIQRLEKFHGSASSNLAATSLARSKG